MFRMILIDDNTIQFSKWYDELVEALRDYDALNKLNSNIKIYIIEPKRRYFKIIKSNV